MTVAIRNAKASCDARNPAAYTGPDLVDLARLCALGQQWPAVIDAATRYIAIPTSPNPSLPTPTPPKPKPTSTSSRNPKPSPPP